MIKDSIAQRALTGLVKAAQFGRRRLQALYRGVVNLLAASLPNRCLMCHQSIELPDSGICSVCLVTGLYQVPVCLGCGRAMQVEAIYCGACTSSRPLMIIAPCSYHQGLGEWVGQMKYQTQFSALPVLSHVLANRILYLEEIGLLQLPQVLIPVPLHSNRLRKRGFNQAYLIADALTGRLNIPVVTEGLTRTIDTCSQAGLTGKQRRKNLSGAFSLEAHFSYQRIALIDDVVTTGTTAIEIAELFEKRHIHVQIWCLARAEAPGLMD
ncbi:competence protein ComF [Shewanella sediminis HAW-EB3]|uniref:Competence protein ComF n=1 Tax=Shewanella sediminis (strain HAW-EB3) TaxID=425104 RepID=A8FPL7_SHESH|nr:amidophosphoribosyltransferase [Shewanella sediminis]ABV34790.1 competence protein ComF [Shewanella sediminis HAW-EB3]